MSIKNGFKVQSKTFEGPIEVLLNLIEKRKLLINDISLSQVTEDYLEYIKSNEIKSLKDSSDFIVVASTLLLIKSKSLLPTLSFTREEKESIVDLEKRLKIYQKIKEGSDLIKEIIEQGNKKTFLPKKIPKIILRKTKKKNVEIKSKNYTPTNIKQSILDVINNLPKKEESLNKAVIKKVISLETAIDSLTNRIKESLQMSFKNFSGYGNNKSEKVNVIVHFLAMLELVKQNVITVKQNNDFEDIEIETKEVSIPNYGQ